MGTSSTWCVTHCLLRRSSIAGSGTPSDCKRLQSCQTDRLLPVAQPPPAGYQAGAQWKDVLRTSAGGIVACGRRGYGFRPGGCGLREGRGPGFRPRGMRASGGKRSGLQAARDAGFRPGGCGLRAGDVTAFVRQGCDIGRVGRSLSRRGCGLCRTNTALGWDVLGSGYGCGGVQPRDAGGYQPGTLRSDAAAIWKYRHSASSYSGSSASSSSAARMCRSHASCAAIPIAKRA
jgi:hypothetical protein